MSGFDVAAYYASAVAAFPQLRLAADAIRAEHGDAFYPFLMYLVQPLVINVGAHGPQASRRAVFQWLDDLLVEHPEVENEIGVGVVEMAPELVRAGPSLCGAAAPREAGRLGAGLAGAQRPAHVGHRPVRGSGGVAIRVRGGNPPRSGASRVSPRTGHVHRLAVSPATLPCGTAPQVPSGSTCSSIHVGPVNDIDIR